MAKSVGYSNKHYTSTLFRGSNGGRKLEEALTKEELEAKRKALMDDLRKQLIEEPVTAADGSAHKILGDYLEADTGRKLGEDLTKEELEDLREQLIRRPILRGQFLGDYLVADSQERKALINDLRKQLEEGLPDTAGVSWMRVYAPRRGHPTPALGSSLV